MKAPYSHLPRQPLTGWLLISLFMALAGLALPSRAPAQNQLTLIDITNTVWRFNDSGTNLGTAWRAASYPAETNSGWSTGTGLFGVDTTQAFSSLYPAPIHTPMVLGAGRITYYFRTRFLLPQDPASNVVEVTLWADDGAVVYVNGTEVARVRLTNDPVLFDTKAQLATPEGLPLLFTNDPTKLVLGTNVIAVEVHQQNENSSDVVFGLQMVATGTQPPAILDPTEPADRTVNQGQPTTFSVVGSGIPAPVYRWFHNDRIVTNLDINNQPFITGADGPTLSIAAVRAEDAGNYFAMLSNSLGTATSRVAELIYLADTNPPYVLYALGRDFVRIELPFSEVPNFDSATDAFNWVVRLA
ncbi:MAG TPA: immunoglobulin domain-containing protein, partial [Verrucomicrobiae bacterium]|nr:immunoglobulin domain-containing protein [Verrucomicrobiae bacterium]